jgi:hypothetical protein
MRRPQGCRPSKGLRRRRKPRRSRRSRPAPPGSAAKAGRHGSKGEAERRAAAPRAAAHVSYLATSLGSAAAWRQGCRGGGRPLVSRTPAFPQLPPSFPPASPQLSPSHCGAGGLALPWGAPPPPAPGLTVVR